MYLPKANLDFIRFKYVSKTDLDTIRFEYVFT